MMYMPRGGDQVFLPVLILQQIIGDDVGRGLRRLYEPTEDAATPTGLSTNTQVRPGGAAEGGRGAGASKAAAPTGARPLPP